MDRAFDILQNREVSAAEAVDDGRIFLCIERTCGAQATLVRAGDPYFAHYPYQKEDCPRGSEAPAGQNTHDAELERRANKLFERLGLRMPRATAWREEDFKIAVLIYIERRYGLPPVDPLELSSGHLALLAHPYSYRFLRYCIRDSLPGVDDTISADLLERIVDRGLSLLGRLDGDYCNQALAICPYPAPLSAGRFTTLTYSRGGFGVFRDGQGQPRWVVKHASGVELRIESTQSTELRVVVTRLGESEQEAVLPTVVCVSPREALVLTEHTRRRRRPILYVLPTTSTPRGPGAPECV